MLVTESINLHGYTLEETNKIKEQHINESYLKTWEINSCYRKGPTLSKWYRPPIFQKDLSILKYSVPDFKKGNEDLIKKILTERCWY